jgi:hypothetical protein
MKREYKKSEVANSLHRVDTIDIETMAASLPSLEGRTISILPALIGSLPYSSRYHEADPT